MSKKDKLFFILIRMVSHFIQDGISRSAAELTFYLLFSLFPLIMVLNSLLAVIRIPADTILQIAALFPAAVRELLLNYMKYLQQTPALRPLVLGSVLSLYFLSRAVRSMMHTFGDLYGRPTRKSVVRSILISLLMTLLCLLMLASSLILIVLSRRLIEWLLRWFPQTENLLPMWTGVGTAFAAASLLLFLLLCYRLLPCVRMRWRDAWPGAVTSLGIWLLLTRGFAFYVDHMASYSLLYGSIGAVIVLMIWLDLSSVTLIMGAVLNHILQIELKEEANRFSAQAVVNKEEMT